MPSVKNPASHFVSGYQVDGRYELLYPYAQGGMATVWVARVTGKHGFEKLVAVKTILAHLANEPGFRAMFLDEASIAARIRHPNVADIVDLGEENGVLYMVIEWVSGDSWSKLYAGAQNRGGFPQNLLLRIAADVCAGLHAAHELRDDNGQLRGVVHRDISPQNVLISTAGVTKIIDFGIAKAVDRASEMTKTGMLKGKAQYAAPEQARSKQVDRRADIWAVGTILYHYLSGRLPYEGANELMTLQRLASGKPPPPLPVSVPPSIAAAVMTALAHAADRRFQTALEMQRALESVMPTPTTAADVSVFLNECLAERLESKRRDLAEAIAEADQRRPRAEPRGRLSTYPELAPVPGVAQGIETVTGRAELPLTTAPSELLITSHELSTRMSPGLRELRATHWLIMAAGAVLPIVVWSLVVYVAMFGPLGHGAR
jgi:serine/threonine-protein kinase